MILSDADIKAHMLAGDILVTPLGTDAVRPASVDLRLGPVIKIEDDNEPDGWRVHDLRAQGPYRLHRGVFVLGATLERVFLAPEIAADIKGKSSRAREGLVLENAGFVDPGWDGELTTEMVMLRQGYLRLEVGMKIGQIRFYRLSSPSERPYGSDGSSHYQGSRGPVASRTRGQRP